MQHNVCVCSLACFRSSCILTRYAIAITITISAVQGLQHDRNVAQRGERIARAQLVTEQETVSALRQQLAEATAAVRSTRRPLRLHLKFVTPSMSIQHIGLFDAAATGMRCIWGCWLALVRLLLVFVRLS